MTSHRRSWKRWSDTRCATLTGVPVRKLSRHTTESPRDRSASHRWEPRKPAPPVTTTRLPDGFHSDMEGLLAWVGGQRLLRGLEDLVHLDPQERGVSGPSPRVPLDAVL